MRRTLIILFCSLFFVSSFSQRSKEQLDSMYRAIPASPDSIKCKILNHIAREIGTNYPDSALILADRSRKIGEKINFPKGVAMSYFLLGFINQNKGKIDNAINYYDKSLTIYKKLNRKNDMSNIYNSLGNVYFQLNNPAGALKNYQTAFDLANREPKSKYYIAISSIGIAMIKGEQKKYDEAIELQILSLNNFKEIGMMHYVPMVLENMSVNYISLNQFDKAKSANDEAISLFESAGDFYGLSNAYSTRVTLLKHSNKLSQALEYARKSYDLSVKINSLPEMSDKAKMVYNFYKETNDYKNSLEFLELYMSYNDSLNNKERSKSIADAEARFDTKQKEQQLQLKNLELEKSEIKVNERNHLIYIFIAAFGIFLILLFLLYKQFNEKKKANVLLENKNSEIEKQKAVIEEKNKDITDSINYSKHIQKAIIPSQQKVKQHFPGSFVIFKPKDIVSGDFYLVEEVVGLTYVAVVDCTGHGVPGAMLSVFANSTIKNTISSNDFRENPAAILSDLCFQFKSNLQSQNTSMTINDGVDMCICLIDKKQNKIYFSGAKIGLIQLRDNQITEYAGSRWGISGSNKGEHLFFTDHIIEAQKEDKFYLCTDGFADQFGGPNGKKFKQKQLNGLLISTGILSFDDQKTELEKTFESWKGPLEQIDDITLVGFSV